MKTKFISLIVSVAVIAGLMLVPVVVSPTLADPGDEWGFEISPSLTKVGFDEDFNVTVKLVRYDGSADSWQMMLDFDPACLEVTSITRVTILPTGNGIDPYPGEPTLNNTTGWVYDGYGIKPMEALVTDSFEPWTVQFHALNPGVTTNTYLNFVCVTPYSSTKVILAGLDKLNWTKVVNGTVMIGSPELEVDVTPRGYPYPMATGGMGIQPNVLDPTNETTMLKIYPYDPLPNYTYWAWDQPLIVAAVDMVPGWAFAGWTPGSTPGSPMPPEELEVGGVNYTIYPLIIQMADDVTETAMFAPKDPEIAVTPPSLAFECFEGINPANKTLMLLNSGGMTLNWSMTDDAGGWLSEVPDSGSLTTSFQMPNATVDVCVNVSGLTAAGSPYSANINITEEGDPANFTLVPVDLTVKPATFVDTFRHIIASADSGKPGETSELYAGETFDVYVNFTAPPTSPPDGFNSIGLTDLAPDGWTVEVNKTWCEPDAYAVDVASDNQAEIVWSGPYAEGTLISAMYKVTVPTTATAGLNTWPLCGHSDEADAWLEYYFNEEGPYLACVKGDWQVTVTQPGDVVGETRDVNSNELGDVNVQLFNVADGYLWNDISSPDYINTAWVTDEYWLVASKTRYNDINTSDAVMLPGIAFTIDLTTPELLADGNRFDFEGDFGLVPKAPDLSYVLRSVNLWKAPPVVVEWDVNGEHMVNDFALSDWKVGDVVNAWLYPS